MSNVKMWRSLQVYQWRAVISEAGHAVGMTMLFMQLTSNTLRIGQKNCLRF